MNTSSSISSATARHMEYVVTNISLGREYDYLQGKICFYERCLQDEQNAALENQCQSKKIRPSLKEDYNTVVQTGLQSEIENLKEICKSTLTLLSCAEEHVRTANAKPSQNKSIATLFEGVQRNSSIMQEKHLRQLKEVHNALRNSSTPPVLAIEQLARKIKDLEEKQTLSGQENKNFALTSCSWESSPFWQKQLQQKK